MPFFPPTLPSVLPPPLLYRPFPSLLPHTSTRPHTSSHPQTQHRLNPRPRIKATAAHIAFLAPARHAVDAFFTAALRAGGTIHGEPAVRDAESGYYNAAVLDLDGNSIEVVHRAGNDTDPVEAPGRQEGSRVLTWQRDVARSCADGRSVVRAAGTVASRVPAPTVVGSSPVPQPPPPVVATGDAGAKAIIGTLLGAAAGAAVAYAMTKADDSSAPPSSSQAGAMPALAAAAQSIYRAIEAGPSAQRPYQPTVQSRAPTTIVLQDLECESAHDAGPAIYPARSSHASQVRSTASSSQRPRTAIRAIEAPPGQEQAQAEAQSVVARSTLINTFVPPSEIARLRPAALPVRVKSETQLSVRLGPKASASQHSASRPATVVRATSTQDVPLATAPRSLVGSVLGLGAKNDSGDAASVAPSDSVSQAGSKKHRSHSHHTHSKSRSDGGSKADARHSSTSRSRPVGSRHGSSASTATRSRKGGGSVVKGEVEEMSSPSSGNDDKRSRASSQRTVRPGDVGGGGGGKKERSSVSLGLAGMGMGLGIGKFV